jgi:hypothetical protein
MFCASGLIFGGNKGVPSRFHVFRSRTCFRRFRGRRVPFLCFALPASFLAVPRAFVPFFMFCAPGLIFGGTGCVGSRFHVLCSRTRFRRYRWRRVPFLCFALPDSFSAVPRVSGPIFTFCSPRLDLGGKGVIGSYFRVLRARTHFDGSEGVDSRVHVLHTRTRFRRYRRRRVPFSCFALADSFTAVSRESCPVFMFCAPGLVFGCVECVGSRFHVLPSRTSLQRYRWRRVPFSRFALRGSFSAVSSASGPVFTFCALGLVFGGTKGVPSRFYVIRPRTCFRRY